MTNVLWLTALVLWLALSMSAEHTVVATCTLEREDATTNNRSEMAYYNCGTSAAFMAVTDSPGDLRLRELSGKTVNILLEPN